MFGLFDINHHGLYAAMIRSVEDVMFSYLREQERILAKEGTAKILWNRHLRQFLMHMYGLPPNRAQDVLNDFYYRTAVKKHKPIPSRRNQHMVGL